MNRYFLPPVALMLALAVNAQGQTPSIAAGAVYNVASYVPSGLPSAAIAQGSLMVIFGSGMGPATLAQAPSLPLTTTLAGTSITVTVNGTSVKPYMVYTSAGQICAVLPSNTPAGTGTISVTYNGATSATQPINVATNSVGIFTVNQAGSGPGIITTTGYAVNTLTTAAKAGDVEIIWATGLGPVGSTGSEAAGTAPIASLPSTFKVYVGGVSATIIGAARSSSPGLDQIAFTVPAGVTGCHVPVVVQTGNTVSNFVSMAIGSGGLCSDPVGTGLTPTQLTTLQQKGNIAIGGINLGRSAVSIAIAGLPSGITIPPTVTDSGSATFSRYTAQQYNTAIGGLTVTTYGACSVFYVTGQSTAINDPIVLTALDAGTPLTVSGPNGTKTLTEASIGNYSATLGSGSSLYLSAGTYTISGPGGKDVGAINTSITLPPALTWANASTISTVTRANGQLVTWTGGDPAGTVDIVGLSIGANNASALFECTAPTSAGSFNVPSVVLLSLPATSGSAIGLLEVGANSAQKNFTATGLDLGYITASSTTAQTVTYN